LYILAGVVVGRASDPYYFFQDHKKVIPFTTEHSQMLLLFAIISYPLQGLRVRSLVMSGGGQGIVFYKKNE
jgi:hypothetical protein